MATDDFSSTMAKASELPAASQDRVHAALKASIDKELSESADQGSLRAAAGFSRGIFFSKSGGGGLTAKMEELVLPALTEMSDTQFQTFAQRLATLKGESTDGG